MRILLHISSTHTYHGPIFRQLAFGEKERKSSQVLHFLSPTPVSGLAERAHDELELPLKYLTSCLWRSLVKFEAGLFIHTRQISCSMDHCFEKLGPSRCCHFDEQSLKATHQGQVPF